MIFRHRSASRAPIEFETREELLGHFKDWTEIEEFVEFSLSKHTAYKVGTYYSLMAVFNESYRWSVLGFIDNPEQEFVEQFPRVGI